MEDWRFLNTADEMHSTEFEPAFRGLALPKAVVDRLMDSGEGIELGGEQRELTVMFLDIRGFTSWSEQHEPEVIVAQLNELLSDLAQPILTTRRDDHVSSALARKARRLESDAGAATDHYDGLPG